MNIQRQTQVTAPDQVVVGTQIEKNQCVKDAWIQQLGGSCVRCGEVYYKQQISQNFKSRASKKRKRSNLDAHYIGEDREAHKKFQLGKLQVPMSENFEKQNSYLKKFASHLCPCELLCKQCHGALHGK